jgi:hypothetical protein
MESQKMSHIIVSCGLCFLMAAGEASGGRALFPFAVPDDDISGGVTDMSFLNQAAADRPITVRDGHFYAGDQRVRFWGMNMCFSANYPAHEEAPMLAQRFAKLGMNIVRITHTDTRYAPAGLLDAKYPGEIRIDTERLERLDFFIAELKKRGVYVELSLHVCHFPLMGKTGIPALGDGRFSFGTGVPLWNEKFQAAEKRFARDFFGHVNPYTGNPYATEPAVAFVEILNENGVICAWRENHFRKTWSSAMIADLQTHWNRFLKAKYQSDEQLRLAWSGGRLAPPKADVVGLPAGESLATGNVSMPLSPTDASRRADRVASDFIDFLYQIDDQYFAGLYSFLKNELGCRHPIKGTQVEHYSSMFSQAKCDFIDTHTYWQHPQFPHNSWDPRDWRIRNIALVDHFGGYALGYDETLVDVAGRRVRGKPYNLSEYCHPAPNTFCAEEIPMVSSFGAMQDWDGIVLFNYASSAGGYRSDRIANFFDRTGHPVKLVTMPFGALAFRRGDVLPGRQESVVGVAMADEKQWQLNGYREKPTWAFPAAANKGVTWRDAVSHRLSLDLGSKTMPELVSPQRAVVSSDTEQLRYDMTDPKACVFTVDAPRAKAVIGFGAGRTFELTDLVVQPGPTMQAGFSVITASVVKGEAFRSPGASVLLTATGYIENSGMGWNADKSSVSDKWGKGPVLCEGVPLEVVFQTKSIRAWALDGRGQRTQEIATEHSDRGSRLHLGPQFKTLWYEVVVK